MGRPSGQSQGRAVVGRPPGHSQGYEAKRQGIIDTAAVLFAKKGFAATGIQELADEVGMAKGALYYYIGSKEALLIEIQRRVLEPLLSSARAIAEVDLNPFVKLRLVSELLLVSIFSRPDHVRVYEHDYRHLSRDRRHEFRALRLEFEAIVQACISEGIDKGALRELDIRLACLQFLNLHNHTYQWVRSDIPWTAEELSREYCATLFHGWSADTAAVGNVEQQVISLRPLLVSVR